MALTRHDAGALTVLGAALFLMFGFLGFAVAVPWVTAVMPVSDLGAFFALGVRLKRYR